MKYNQSNKQHLFNTPQDKEVFPTLGLGAASQGDSIWEASKKEKKARDKKKMSQTRDYDFSRDFTSAHNTTGYQSGVSNVKRQGIGDFVWGMWCVEGVESDGIDWGDWLHIVALGLG